MNLSEGERAPAHSPEDRDDALAALDAVVGLVLPPPDWALVEEALRSLETALRAGDPDDLGEATGQLELAGPARVRTRLGEDDEPAPQDLLDRVNRLVHSLRSEAAGDDAETEPASGDPH